MADERLMNDVMMMEKGHRQGERVGLVSGPHRGKNSHMREKLLSIHMYTKSYIE